MSTFKGPLMHLTFVVAQVEVQKLDGGSPATPGMPETPSTVTLI